MSFTTPTVSIVIPCHNHGDYIEEALASVRAQTFADYEIVIVDDGSTEPSTAARLAAHDRPNCQVLRNATRQGLSAARNLGIQRARGRYILPLDADDRIAPTFLAKTVPCLDQNPQLGIVTTEAEYFGARTGRWQLEPCELPSLLLRPSIFATSLFRRVDWETVGGYQLDMVDGYEDFDFWLAILKLGRSAYRVPEVLFYYRQTASGMLKSMGLEQRVNAYLRIYQHHSELYHANMGFVFRSLLEFADALRTEQDDCVAQVFAPHGADFSETYSVRHNYERGALRELNFEFPELPSPLGAHWRIDPAASSGMFEILALEFRTNADVPAFFHASGTTLLSLARAGGTAMISQQDGRIVLVSYGPDPQILLGPVPVDSALTRLHVTLKLRAAPRLERLERGL